MMHTCRRVVALGGLVLERTRATVAVVVALVGMGLRVVLVVEETRMLVGTMWCLRSSV